LHWYCIASNPGSAEKCGNKLKEKGFEFLLPRMRYQSKKQHTLIRPLFGNYLFVRFDRQNPSWRTIPTTGHVKQLLSADAENPLIIPDRYIEELLTRLDQEHILDQRQKPADSLVGKQLAYDTRYGVWQGLCTESTDHNVKILMQILGGAREVSVERNLVRVVEDAPAS
jgi:hypothetical protein